MKKLISFLFILLVSYFSYSQKTNLTGIVTLQNSGNTPLKGTTISNTWNTTLSNSEGKFNLTFIDRKVGDIVNFKVKKDNYEIVNEKNLKVTLTGTNDYKHKIIMCPKGELAENRIKFYNIAFENITNNYEQQVNQLNKKNKNYTEQIDKLEQQKQVALSNAREMADKFARINLDDVSELYKKAFILYENGNIDSLVSILDSTILSEKKQKIIDAKKRLNKAMIDYSNECMLAGDIYIQKLDFYTAKSRYEWAVEIDTTNYDVTLIYANFLFDYEFYSKAEKQYQKLITVFEKDTALYNEQLAVIYKNLGSIYVKKEEFTISFKYLQKSLLIYDKLNNPIEKANVLYEIAFWYSKRYKFELGEKTLKEAINLLKNNNNDSLYLGKLAFFYQNLANNYQAQERFNDAGIYYKKAIAIYSNNIPEDEIKPLQIAELYIGLGHIYYHKYETDTALYYFQLAEKNYNKYFNAFPRAYANNLIEIYLDIVDIYSYSGEYNKANEVLLNALLLTTKLPEDLLTDTKNYYMEIFTKLFSLNFNENQNKNSIKIIELGYSNFENQEFNSSTKGVLNEYDDMYSNIIKDTLFIKINYKLDSLLNNKPPKEYGYSDWNILLFQSLFFPQKSDSLSRLAYSLIEIIDYSDKNSLRKDYYSLTSLNKLLTNQPDSAIFYMKKVIELYDIQENCDICMASYATTIKSLALMYQTANQADSAIFYYNKTLEVYSKINNNLKISQYSGKIAQIYDLISALYFFEKDNINLSIVNSKKSLEIYKLLAEKDTNYELNVYFALTSLLVSYQALSENNYNYKDSIISIENEIANTTSKLLTDYPQLRNVVAFNYFKLAENFKEKKIYKEAANSYQSALDNYLKIEDNIQYLDKINRSFYLLNFCYFMNETLKNKDSTNYTLKRQNNSKLWLNFSNKLFAQNNTNSQVIQNLADAKRNYGTQFDNKDSSFYYYNQTIILYKLLDSMQIDKRDYYLNYATIYNLLSIQYLNKKDTTNFRACNDKCFELLDTLIRIEPENFDNIDIISSFLFIKKNYLENDFELNLYIKYKNLYSNLIKTDFDKYFAIYYFILKRLSSLYTNNQKYIEAIDIENEKLNLLKQKAPNYGNWSFYYSHCYKNISFCYNMLTKKQKAIKYANKSLKSSKKFNNQQKPSFISHTADIYSLFGLIYENSNIDTALYYYKLSTKYFYQALTKIPNDLSYLQLFIETNNKVGAIYLAKHQLDSALVVATKSEDVTKKINGHDFFYASTYKLLGEIYFEMGNLIDTKKYLTKALTIYESNGMFTQRKDTISMAEIHAKLAQFYLFTGNADNAEREIIGALEIYQNLFITYPNIEYNIADSYFFLGEIKDYKKESDSAILFYKKSIKIYEKNKNKNKDNHNIKNTLGYYSYILGKSYLQKYKNTQNKNFIDSALFYNEKAFSNYKKNEQANQFFIAITYSNKGEIYFQSYNDDKAIEYYSKANEIFYTINNPLDSNYIAFNNYRIATSYFYKKEYLEAIKFFNKAIPTYKIIIKQQQNTLSDYSNLLNFLAICYRETNQLEKAESYFFKSLSIIENNPKFEFQVAINYVGLIKLYGKYYEKNKEQKYKDLILEYETKAITIFNKFPANQSKTFIEEINKVKSILE